MRAGLKTLLWLALAWLARPDSVSACAVCFGAPDSPLTKGMAWGILSLLVVIGCVLATVAAFFVYLARRASTAEVPVPGGKPVETPTLS